MFFILFTIHTFTNHSVVNPPPLLWGSSTILPNIKHQSPEFYNHQQHCCENIKPQNTTSFQNNMFLKTLHHVRVQNIKWQLRSVLWHTNIWNQRMETQWYVTAHSWLHSIFHFVYKYSNTYTLSTSTMTLAPWDALPTGLLAKHL